jgi:hypothetical protein
MYSWKDYARATLILIGIMALLGGFMVLNGLHYAGVL